MSAGELALTLVKACTRDDAGGSLTAVLGEGDLSEMQRRAAAVQADTSHAVFVSDRGTSERGPVVGMRFYTREGELPACGHGTVAAMALIAARAGGDAHLITVHTTERVFEGHVTRRGNRLEALFDPGPVTIRDPTALEIDALLAALGLSADTNGTAARIASVGRERLLLTVPDHDALAAVAPDFRALADACDQSGLLGCYVHTPPDPSGRMAARMFAPSIGVPEDVANANSTACLAAVLYGDGVTRIAADMGDSLGSPATITASTRAGVSRPRVLVGGAATIVGDSLQV